MNAPAPDRAGQPSSEGEATSGTDERRVSVAAAGLDGMEPETRQRIREAVLAIFSTREFHRVGLIEVARAASVSLQTIYKYYGSKEVLLFCSLDDELERLAQRMLDALGDTRDHKACLRRAFHVALVYFEHNPRVLQLMLSSVHVNSWRKLGNYEHRDLFGALRGVFADGREKAVLTDEVDEHQLLDFVAGVLMRTMQSWVVRGMKDSPSKRSDALFEMVWRAIARPR